MNLITFSFVIDPELQKEFVEAIEKLRLFWKEQNFHLSFFREHSENNRFMLMYLTQKTVDELVALLHAQKEAKTIFDRIKDLESRVIVSSYEQLV